MRNYVYIYILFVCLFICMYLQDHFYQVYNDLISNPQGLQGLQGPNAGAASTCRLDVSLDLFHSLSLSKPSTSPYPQSIAAPLRTSTVAAMALAEALALRVKELLGSRLAGSIGNTLRR